MPLDQWTSATVNCFFVISWWIWPRSNSHTWMHLLHCAESNLRVNFARRLEKMVAEPMFGASTIAVWMSKMVNFYLASHVETHGAPKFFEQFWLLFCSFMSTVNSTSMTNMSTPVGDMHFTSSIKSWRWIEGEHNFVNWVTVLVDCCVGTTRVSFESWVWFLQNVPLPC